MCALPLATAALTDASRTHRQVLFKSSKLMPVMAFRALVGNVASNTWRDYAYACMICGGLTIFTMADHSQAGEVRGAPSRSPCCGGRVLGGRSDEMRRCTDLHAMDAPIAVGEIRRSPALCGGFILF